MIDPGPDVELHVRALASAVSGADVVSILLTHDHADHVAAAPALAHAIGTRATVYGPEGLVGVDQVLVDGDLIPTDEGHLLARHTPGHTPEHLSFQWPDRRAFFAGDLVLGEGDTTWVAEYSGCVADYLSSLDLVRGLDLSVIYPTHGPPLEDPLEAIDRFAGHRRTRIAQVERAMTEHPEADVETLLDVVYGDALPDSVRGAARMSLAALVEYVRDPRVG